MSRSLFTRGPISPAFVAESLASHGSKTEIGAHSLFLGQVRADEGKNGQVRVAGGQVRVAGGQVIAIEYTAYEDMALDKMHEIREAIFARHPLTCLHVYHSLGRVEAGEISLFVFASAPHRRAAIDACAETVEAIKASLPVWGREILEQGQSRWKWST